MVQKTILLALCASGLSISAALGFSTDTSSLVRNCNTNSAATNAPITVTATFTNGGAAALRGFCYSEQIPSGLAVTVLGLRLNGQSITNYTFESGLDGDVYSGCTACRWALELPTSFTENHPVSPNAIVQIQYSITSPTVGSFNLQQFNWAGYNPANTNAAFGYSESSDAQSVSFNAGSPPTYPILATTSGMNFSAIAGTDPANQALGITNSGGGILNWTAVAEGGTPAWLTVSPTNGSGNGAVSVSVASASLTPGTYSRSITVTAVGASNSPQAVMVNLNVTGSGSGTNHYDFNYASRADLLAGGWDFLARTASGAARNTEQTTGAVADYNQVTHPGVLRIPADAGDLWAAMNNTRNSLFRDVPTNWTSLRVKLSFAPTQNYQQAGFAIYQNDDNYVYVDRIYNGGNKITCSREVGGSASVVSSVNETATTNLYLRLDRNAATGTISAYYSLNGTSWVGLGSAVQTVNTPRVGIIAGSSPGGFPNADFAWVEVIAPPSGPTLTVSPLTLSFSAVQGASPASQSLGITNNGSGTLTWTALADQSAPAWLNVNSTNGSGNTNLIVSVASAGLVPGNYSRSITVTATGAGNSPQTVTVNLAVTLSNQPPVANADSYSVATGAVLTVSAPGVLGNDTDANSNLLNAVLVSGVAHGTLSLSNNGAFTYTPVAGYSGSDSFTYQANDGITNSGIAIVNLTVTALPGVLFADNFTRATDPGPLAPWLTAGGTWSVSGGTLKGSSARQNYGYAYVTNSWTDYSVESRIRFPAGAYGGGLGGRLNPVTGTHYAAWVYPEGSVGGSRVLKLKKQRNWDSWSGTPMQQVALASVGTNWHTLKIIFEGTRIRVLFDGSQVMDVTDNGFDGRAAYPSGGINASVWNYTSIYTMNVDDVVVSALDNPPAAAGTVAQGSVGVALPGSGKIESLIISPDGQVHLTLRALAGQTFVVQASTNLESWDDLMATVNIASESAGFVDVDAPKYRCRFYRVKLFIPAVSASDVQNPSVGK